MSYRRGHWSRPDKATTKISARLPADQLETIDRIASRNDMSRADVVRLLIDEGLKNARRVARARTEAR